MPDTSRPSPARELDVAVLGEVAVDVTLQVQTLPEPGEFVLARSRDRLAGGSAGNVAVGLARLGQRVGFFGAIGDDEDGQFLRRAFELEGVDTANLIDTPGYGTPSCLVIVNDLGERTILGLPRDPVGASLDCFDLEALRAARLVFVGPTHTGIARRLTAALGTRDITLAYAPGGLCHCLEPRDLQPMMERADILFVNGSEAMAVTDVAPPEEAIGGLVDVGPRLIVGTLGENGALVVRGKQRYRIPAVPVTRVRDTTGAGDAFAAGFIAAHLRGLDPRQAARVGSAAAALTIRRLGARVGLPSWEEALSVVEVGLDDEPNKTV